MEEKDQPVKPVKKGNTSKAWVSLEKSWEKALKAVGFRAKRISRAADIGRSDHDVNMVDLPNMKSDCKYRVGGWAHHSLFYECEKKYVKKNSSDFLVLPTKAGGETGMLVTLRHDVFADILAKAYLKNKTSSAELSCPRCAAQTKSVETGLDLSQASCEHCGFEFMYKRVSYDG